MVKQIGTIENNANMVNIFPEVSVLVNNMDEHKHAEKCQCEACELIGKDKKTIAFIKKARNKHGDRYGYSKSNLEKVNSEHYSTIITCYEHGDFRQRIDHHLNGSNCQECAGNKKLTVEKFVEKATKVHGDEYGYSFIKEIVDGKTKIEIFCKKHGIFKQLASSHLRGSGCSECYGNKKITSDKFFENSNKIHKNKFDYSKSKFKGLDEKIKIFCQDHGYFWQMASDHLYGRGCKKCGFIEIARKKNSNSEEFVEKSITVHGNLYDYQYVKYTKADENVIIVCKIHCKFKQTPNNHLKGYGCLECGGRKQLTTEKFVKKAKLKFGNEYDYSLVKYIDSHTEVEIICSKHGIFSKKPNKHLSGQGCPDCKSSMGKNEISRIIRNQKLKYKSEKWFENLTNPKTGAFLMFDVFVEKYNLCIEYDGEQHYKPAKWFGPITDEDAEITFIEQQYRDGIKTQYCLDNKINLLRIPYWDFKNIDKIILAAIEKIKTSETSYVSNLY